LWRRSPYAGSLVAAHRPRLVVVGGRPGSGPGTRRYGGRLHERSCETLALIQRRARIPQQVIQLAGPEREAAEAWLFDVHATGRWDGRDLTLAAGIMLIQPEVEAQHEVPRRGGHVGACDLDDGPERAWAAARRRRSTR